MRLPLSASQALADSPEEKQGTWLANAAPSIPPLAAWPRHGGREYDVQEETVLSHYPPHHTLLHVVLPGAPTPGFSLSFVPASHF